MSRDFQDCDGNTINVFTEGVGNCDVQFNGRPIKLSVVCEMMKYIMTNMDLGKDDPRQKLRGWIKRIRIGPGWNEGGRKYIQP